MANTYTQLYTQLIFAVKGRQSLIPKPYQEDVQRYITGIAQNHKHKMMAIKCMPDHIHIFLSKHPAQSESDLVEDIKTGSNGYINGQSWMRHKFEWQRGFGAFSYGKTQSPAVVRYVLNQEENHNKRTFREEYLNFLQKFEVDYDERYLFDFLNDVEY